jgi:hypothetical protein
MKSLIRISSIALLTGLTLAASPAFAQVAPNVPQPIDGFEDLRPGVRTLRHGDQVGRVFGTLATGATPSDSARAFIEADCMRVWGVSPADLAAYGPFETGEHIVQIMPDEETGGHRFTGVYFTQQVRGVPVYKANLLVLTRNEQGFPAVLASSTLWNVSGIEQALARTNLGALPPQKVWTRNALNQFRSNPVLGPAQYVVWAGLDRVRAAEPRLAVQFTAEGGGHWDPSNHQRIEFVVDAENGAILHQESKIYHAVTGRVTGIATQGLGADTCNPETQQGLPYVRITGGATPDFADVNGNFSVAAGAPGATYTTSLVGRWFTTTNNGAATVSLSTTANDGASWNPVFNPTGTVAPDLAQVNAYLQSNLIRDIVVAASPTFPTVSTQTSAFQINVNLAQTCNAYYTGDTINFYSAGGGCANTAFGDVVAHEYGHNVVAKGGSGQGAYGEGMGDIHGILLTDNPQTGVGFQTCANGIRTAQNTCQFAASGCSTGTTAYGATCGSAIHSCGQLISGCFWDLRNRLQASYPSDYRARLAAYAINSVLLHGAVTSINNEITVDVLTLDDDNGNIGDGSPNYTLINDAFTIHGMPGPALQLVTISYPNGQPAIVSPSGGTPLSVRIEPVVGTPNPSTAKLFAKVTPATTYTEYPMTAQGGNLYSVNLPGGTCPADLSYYVSVQTTAGVTVTSPSAGSVAPFQAPVVGGLETVLDEAFELSNAGWTVGATGDNATTGLWVRVDPLGTSTGGQPVQPEDDHTPSGTQCWITGQGAAGGSVGSQDVDGGVTTLTSPAFDCSGLDDPRLSYWRWYSNNTLTGTGTDVMPVEISNNNGTTWVPLENVTQNAGAWVLKEFRIADFVAPTSQVRVRFRAQDQTPGDYVEAGVDDVRVFAATCPPENPADLDGNGVVNGADLGLLLNAWGTPQYDLTGDGTVSGADVGFLLGYWG